MLCRKLICLVCFVLVLSLAGSAQAEWWTNGNSTGVSSVPNLSLDRSPEEDRSKSHTLRCDDIQKARRFNTALNCRLLERFRQATDVRLEINLIQLQRRNLLRDFSKWRKAVSFHVTAMLVAVGPKRSCMLVARSKGAGRKAARWMAIPMSIPRFPQW